MIGTPPVSSLEPFTRVVLPCGLRVVVREDHFAPVAAAAVWVGAGTADEAPEKNGLSHFYEHMLFKGTETRGVGDIDRQIAALGGYNNASTSHDFTDYYVVVPSDHLSEAVNILCDAVLDSTFPPAEIENERRVIVEEIHRQEDSPLGKLSDVFYEAAFRGTPYALPILGRVETLDRVAAPDFAAYRDAMYRPSNLVLAVSGDVETRRILDRVGKIFDGRGKGPAQRPGKVRVEPPDGPLRVIVRKDVEQTYLLMGYPVPDVTGTRDEYALDVAAAILGEGRSSRLFRNLHEERGLVSYIDADFSAFRRAGLFSMEAGLEEDSVDEVTGVLLEEIERVAHGGFAAAEFERAKTLTVVGYSMSNQKASSVAGTLGLYEIMDDIEAAVRYPERILAVTPEDVARAVAKYCPPTGYTLAVMQPLEDA